MIATARVTAASLRADLANASATNHRLSAELAALRRRLGQLLGQEVLNDLSAQQTADIAAVVAPRQINRDLLSRVNRHAR